MNARTPNFTLNIEYANALLKLLGRDEFEFRPFADSEAAKQSAGAGIARYIGPLSRHADKLRQHNGMGCSICVQINATDGGGFKSENIVSAPCFYVDLDGPPRSNLDRVPISPHLIVESSPGKWHAYWRVEGIPIAEFKGIQQRLARLTDGDPAVVDLARVMRLPGSLHQKNPDAPFLVRPVFERDAPAIPFGAFMNALAEAERERGITVAQKRAAPSKEKKEFSGDVGKADSALAYLIDQGELDLGEYDQWINLAIALKNDHEEEGFALWHSLSKSSDKYESEYNCREKWDTITEPSGPRLTMATYFKRAKDAGWQPPKSRSRTGGEEKPPAPAIIAIRLAEAAGDKFWIDQLGQPCATFTAHGTGGIERRCHAQVSSAVYRDELAVRYNDFDPNKALSKDQLQTAVNLLCHKAKRGDRHEAYLRSAAIEDMLYIDLGRADGAVLCITGETHELVENPPVRFLYRGEAMGELPLPQAGGVLDDFSRHFNLSPADIVKVCAVIATALAGAPAYPICLIEGTQGTGKSTLGDMILALVDPPAQRKQGRMSFPNKEQDLLVRTKNSHMPYFDNISTVDQAASDALCRLATGGSFASRKLYSDGDEHVLSALRPVLATCIGAPTQRGDFLDRCVSVSAQLIERPRTENAVWKDFEKDRPKLFGFIIMLIQAVLRNRKMCQDDIDSGRIAAPRLADFTCVAEAASEVFGLERGAFSASMRQAQRQLQAESATSHPVIQAIIDKLSNDPGKPISGMAREVLQSLRREDYTGAWTTPGQLKRLLMRHHAGLTALGVQVEYEPGSGHENRLRYRITATERFIAPDKALMQPAF